MEKRSGIIFFVYRKASLKAEVRKYRGSTVCASVKDAIVIYNSFKKFLK